MMNLFKRIAAATLCVLLVIACFAGCHGKDAVVATAKAADGSELNITSGVYLAMLITADNEARGLVEDQLGSTASSQVDVTKQNITVDGQTYKFYDYVDMRVKELCHEYLVNQYIFKKYNRTLSEDEELNLSYQAQMTWYPMQMSLEQPGGLQYLFEGNGVNLTSFTEYMRSDYKNLSVFNYFYGEGGSKAPEKKTVEDALVKNFIVVNELKISTKDSSGKALSDEKLAEIEKKLNGYAERIKKGESFADIKAAYDAEVKAEEEANKNNTSSGATSSGASSAVSSTASGSASSAAASSAATSSEATSSAATSSGAASSAATSSEATSSGSTTPEPKDPNAVIYPSKDVPGTTDTKLFDEFSKSDYTLDQPVVKKNDDGYYRLVIRKSPKEILADDYYMTSLESTVLHILFDADFDKFVAEEGKNVTVEYNNYERDYLKPQKIDYTEYLSYRQMLSGYSY